MSAFSAEQRAALSRLLRLKSVLREGWRRHPIEDVESVADHSFGVALLAWFLSPPHLNRERVLELALIHDLPEVLTGDLTPRDGVPADQKAKAEVRALEELTAELPCAMECRELLLEYQAQESEESRWVKMMDKLEMVLQSENYECDHPGLDLSEFRDSAATVLSRLNQLPTDELNR